MASSPTPPAPSLFPSATHWLDWADWYASAPNVPHASSAWFSYACAEGSGFDEAKLDALCFASRLSDAPAQVIVEHPWQAAWLGALCQSHIQARSVNKGVQSVALPRIDTLSSLVSNRLATQPVLSSLSAALSLARGMRSLAVLDTLSQAKHLELAQQMLKLLGELAFDAALGASAQNFKQNAIQNTNQNANLNTNHNANHNTFESALQTLLEGVFLSREAQWLRAALVSLQDLCADLGHILPWEAQIQAVRDLAKNSFKNPQAVWVLPAAHPGVMMRVLLLSVDEGVQIGVPRMLTHAVPSQTPTQLTVQPAEDFESEAQAACAWVVRSISAHVPPQNSAPKNKAPEDTPPPQGCTIAVVAHDRVLGRRFSALLARADIAVEDRVGWALSTTLAASVPRGLLAACQDPTPVGWMHWLALPMVQVAHPHARPCLAFLSARWHALALAQDSHAFMDAALAAARLSAGQGNDSNAGTLADGVHDCLLWLQTLSRTLSQPATLGAHATALIDALANIRAGLLADPAGALAWQALLDLSLETDAGKLSPASFVAVLDAQLEQGRFSSQLADLTPEITDYDLNQRPKARVVLLPFYELAWFHADHVLMLGCNEAHFPPPLALATPLLQAVRTELGLSPKSAEPAVWQHILANVSRIHCTYTPQEASYPSRISPWLAAYAAQAPASGASEGLATERVIAELYAATPSAEPLPLPLTLPSPPTSPLPSHLTLLTSQLPTRIGVSQLAQLLQCPYKFALGALAVKPLAPPPDWPQASEKGTLLHHALDQAYRSSGQDKPAAMSSQAASQRLEANIQSQMRTHLGKSGKYVALAHDASRTAAPWAAENLQSQSEGWQQTASELAIRCDTLLPGLQIVGNIDRLDRLDIKSRLDTIGDSKGEKADDIDSVRLIDYKTSAPTRLKSFQDEPLQAAQLAIYALMLRESGHAVTQAAYWGLHDGKAAQSLYSLVKTVKPSKKDAVALNDGISHNTASPLLDLNSLLDKLQSALQTAWDALRTGQQASATPSASACEYCPYSGVCRSAFGSNYDTQPTDSIDLNGVYPTEPEHV